MKKQNEIRYIVTAVASIPVYKFALKTDAYKQATKPGWGTVEWYSAEDGYKNPVYRDRSDKTQQLCYDEDCSASIYTKCGGYFGIFPYEEINTKEIPKQAEAAAIICSDSCGYNFWTQDGAIRIFVTYDANGLIDNFRLEYGDTPVYDGEVEISFDELYERAEEDYRETYRADIPGTVEYQRKQESAQTEQTAAEAAENTDTAEQGAEQDAEPVAAGADSTAAGNGKRDPQGERETEQKAGGGAGPPPTGKRETGVKAWRDITNT